MTRVVTLLALTLLAWPAQAQPDRINVDVEDADLGAVCAAIAGQVGATILTDPALDERVTVSLRDIPWREALDVIAMMTRCQVEEWPGGLLHVSQPVRLTVSGADLDGLRALELAAQAGGRDLFIHPGVGGRIPALDLKEVDWRRGLEAVAAALGAQVYDASGVLVVAKRGAPAPPGAEAPAPFTGGAAVSVDVDGVALADVCDQIGEAVEANVLVDPEVDATVSLALRDVPWRDAVAALARLTGCQVEQREHGIVLLTRAPANTIEVLEAPLPEVVQLLAPYAGLNVVVAPGRYAPVRARLSRVHWGQAIGLLAWAQGARAEPGAQDVLTLQPGEAPVDAPARPDDAIATWVDAIESAARAGNVPALEDRVARLLDVVRADEARARPAAPAAASPKQAEAQVNALFEEITALADARDVDGLVEKFAELREAMDALGEAGSREVRRKLGSKRWRERMGELGEVQLSIQLQVHINEGNRHLRALEDAETAAEVEVAKAALQREVEAMRNEEREVFHRNADALALRGEALAARANERIAALALPLWVSAIVVPPELSDQPPRALINGVVLAPGDPVPELEGVRVEAIQASVVTFAKGDFKFVRALR